MTTTPWKKIGSHRRMRVTYGMRKLGSQEPYFSMTGETERGPGRWREDSGGQMPDEIKKFFPELKPLLKWHLVSETEGPMHYEANALYWYKERNLPHFKSTVIFGALPDDEKTIEGANSEAEIREWLRERLPALMEAFHEDMQKFEVN